MLAFLAEVLGRRELPVDLRDPVLEVGPDRLKWIAHGVKLQTSDKERVCDAVPTTKEIPDVHQPARER